MVALTVVLFVLAAAIVLALTLRYESRATGSNKARLWLLVPALILSVYCLCTCWFWPYYAVLYICLPFYLLAVLLTAISYKLFGTSSFFKNVLILLTAVPVVSMTFFFLILGFD
jgi:hypothetical protein